MTAIFVINGPKRVGKDAAAGAIVKGRPDWLVKPMAELMKRETLGAHNVDPDLVDIYDAMKDDPLDDFGGLTFRQLVIEYGNTMREREGETHFADMWAREIAMLASLGCFEAFVMPDCRFMCELLAAHEITPNVLLMRVLRRPKPFVVGATNNQWRDFEGDIGSYLYPDVADVPQVALINDRTLEDLHFEAHAAAYQFYRARHGAAAL